jgi:phosphoglycolate phosphatase-like HAD superfamily hydrolase
VFSVRVVVLTYNLSNCSDTTLSFKTLMNRRRGENAGLSVLIIQSWTVEQEGYNDGVPVTEDWFREHISGKHNSEIGKDLFPSWDQEKQDKWLDEKEAYFRRLAAQHLEPVRGLHRLTDWVREKGLRRAAVTNAPRPNAEQMIDTLGLKDFFDHVVVGSECERAKPFPDPYLKALEQVGVSTENAFAIEVCHNLPAHPNKWLQMMVYRGMRFELVCFTLLL